MPGEGDAGAGERVAAGMYERDVASQRLGMRVARVGPGHAELAMTVRDDMLNGHAICHGGFVFTLSPTARSPMPATATT
jgi:acyl-CoA thioesterase